MSGGILRTRLRLGHQTIAYPDGPARFPERFRGRPAIDPARCRQGCAECEEACPTEAITRPAPGRVALDTGACVFCGRCEEACRDGAIVFTRDYRLSMRRRQELTVTGEAPQLAAALDAKMKRIFGRSLKLRQVSAGGCNGCEAELNAAGNIQFDLSRFGIQFVASPRHADGVVVTGWGGQPGTYRSTGTPRASLAPAWQTGLRANMPPEMAQAPTAMTSRGAGVASQVACSAARMFSETGPVTTMPSAWRGEATNWIPKRPRSNWTFPLAFSSASHPLQPAAETCRSRSERPKSRCMRRSSARASSGSAPVTRSSSRVRMASR